MISYRIPLKGLKFSTNKIYAGVHWSKRKQVKDSILSYAGVFCRPIKKLQSYPVEIRYRFSFRETKPLDTLNTAAMAKMFEDALCALGILEDDSPKFVARSILEVDGSGASKGKKAADASGKQRDEENQDWLEINITTL